MYLIMLPFLILQRLMNESTKRYRREQELMLSCIHSIGMRTARNHLGVPQQQSRLEPTSWLGVQRKTVGGLSARFIPHSNLLHRSSAKLCDDDRRSVFF